MKRMFSVWCLIMILLFLSGCNTVSNKDITPSTTTVSISSPATEDSSSEAEPTSRYIINEKSTVKSDLDYFGIEMTSGDDSLALSDICAIFPDDDTFYLYFRMPTDTESSAYRVNTIIINSWEYALELLEVNGSYQKYKIENVHLSEDNAYEITETTYRNEKDWEDTWTYNMSQVCTVAIDDKAFFFQQEYHYNITLQGQLFESIYQFDKDKNVFQDLWNNAIHNTDGLDVDKRSFFYFAFNCYDVERNIRFTPDDILRLNVEYNKLSYTYEGNDKDEAKNITAKTKQESDSIVPDEIKVVSDSKYSNKKMYKYNTINKLTDADLNKNVGNANAKTLQTAAKSYEWAVQFGNKQGYPYKMQEAGFIFKTYDYEYTQIEDFKAIHIVYRYEGKTFDLNTNSLIADTTVTTVEDIKEPTKKEKEEYEDTLTDQKPELNWFEKQEEKISRRIGPIKIKVTIAILLVLFGIIIGLRIRLPHKSKMRHDNGSIEEFAQSVVENLERRFDDDEDEQTGGDDK